MHPPSPNTPPTHCPARSLTGLVTSGADSLRLGSMDLNSVSVVALRDAMDTGLPSCHDGTGSGARGCRGGGGTCTLICAGQLPLAPRQALAVPARIPCQR